MKRSVVLQSGLAFLALVSLASVPISGFVFAVDDIDQAIEDKQKEADAKKNELEQSNSRQYSYEQEGLTLAEKITTLSSDLESVSAQIEENENTLEELGNAVVEKSHMVEERVVKRDAVSRALYKMTRMNIVEIMLSADGISDMLQQFGFRKFGIEHLVGEVRDSQDELLAASGEFNQLSDEIVALESDLESLKADVTMLENQKIAYEQMAAAEAARRKQLTGEIANITAEQRVLIAAKMAATEEATSVGEYENVQIEIPAAPFSPAYAVASVGYPHRLGMSQYGAYGRAKAGQTYKQILSAYFNATLESDYQEMENILVDGYGSMSFEGQYLKGIAEMPTSWAGDGGYEALKAQAILARTYAIKFTKNGLVPICTIQQCQVYYHPKVSDPAAAEWHRAVLETEGQVLTSGGQAISAFYASTAGGYTRLPADFDVWGSSGSNLPYLKRVADIAPDGKAYDGPGHGNSPWYYKVWYDPSVDVHPWLTKDEMTDLLNAALLPDSYNQYLSHPDLGGWTAAQVRSKLQDLGITPLSGISTITVIDSTEGYTATLKVQTSSGLRDVGGWRFNNVYKLRSRGHLVLWSSLYDVIAQ